MILAGKMYRFCKKLFAETAVFDEKLEIIATIKNDETFVALETSEGIGMNPEIFLGGSIHKLKILTTDGKIGYTSFWYDEIELVKTL